MPAYTVLIVEDDVALVDELRDALRDQEVVARVAGDSAAAIELLKTQKFCGLVLDLVLPDIDFRPHRLLTALLGVGFLLYGFIREAE